MKRIIILLALLTIGCSIDKSPSDGRVTLRGIPPEGKTVIFQDTAEVYEYFKSLTINDNAEMIRVLKDEHPLVDSLKAIFDRMINNSFGK